jgi:class 3 adenylate cyclase
VNCPACQRDNPADSNFCNHCGARMSAPAPTQVREPRDYTPAHLARKILKTRFAVEGERKPVTVLFIDLKGSVELSAGRDPEEWHEVMDQFFERLTRGVHRFEGTVNQYTGDGVMALFGAPIAHEDHAQRACYAALFLRDELRLGESLAEIGHGRACLFGGDPEAALAVFEAGLARTQTSRSYAYQELPYWVAIARANLALGAADAAFDAADAAIERAAGRGFYGADAHLARALAGLARDGAAPLPAIELDLERAEQLAGAGHATSRLPFVARARAECERRRGNGGTQRAALVRARDAFAEMGVARLQRELDRELPALDIGDLS